jgi:hypothetical protein
VHALTRPAPAPSRRRLIGPGLLSAGCVAATGLATTGFVELARAWL